MSARRTSPPRSGGEGKGGIWSEMVSLKSSSVYIRVYLWSQIFWIELIPLCHTVANARALRSHAGAVRIAGTTSATLSTTVQMAR